MQQVHLKRGYTVCEALAGSHGNGRTAGACTLCNGVRGQHAVPLHSQDVQSLRGMWAALFILVVMGLLEGIQDDCTALHVAVEDGPALGEGHQWTDSMPRAS